MQWPREDGRRARWSQTLRCKIHQSNSTKQITGNFLGATASTHGVPSACIPRNLDQRGALSLSFSLDPRPFSLSRPFFTSRCPLISPLPSSFEISPLSSPRFILPTCLSSHPNIEFWLLDRWLLPPFLFPRLFSLPTCLRTYVAHLEWNEAGFRCSSSRLSNRLRNPCFDWGRIGLEGLADCFCCVTKVCGTISGGRGKSGWCMVHGIVMIRVISLLFF